VRAVAGLAEPEDDENGGPSKGANGAVVDPDVEE